MSQLVAPDEYGRFLKGKSVLFAGRGVPHDDAAIGDYLFPFQKFIVSLALNRGRSAIFADTGLGKSRMQIAWADRVVAATGKPVLIFCPLAVAAQTVREGAAVGVCVNLPSSKERDGFIGIKDFRGLLISMFEEVGFIYHSEVCIWKDPVVQMQRTKALGLLHKQIKKDSCMSRQGIADYLVTMRKPGVNDEPVTHTNESFPVGVWQRYASPVWMDINPSDTLQYTSARENEDERHICPLQLGVIRRAINLWSNPGDLVLSPFTGIGSEGHVALSMGRKFVGAELKRSYYEQACRNLAAAESQGNLFDTID